MPILGPSGLVFLFSDLDSEVIIKCENKTSDLSRADAWLRDAVLEIASNPDYKDDFVELEVVGPTFNLTGAATIAAGAVQEYDESNIMPAGDICDATLDIMLWNDFPTNAQRIRLNPSHYQEEDKFLQTPGIPAKWYRFGGSIGFSPPPNQNYQVQARALRQHPINDNVLSQTQILLPRDWNEILVLAAVEKGFIEYLEYEKATAIHTLLHGDPLHPEKPGLIYGRKKKRMREAWRDVQSLRPIVRGYGWGRS